VEEAKAVEAARIKAEVEKRQAEEREAKRLAEVAEEERRKVQEASQALIRKRKEEERLRKEREKQELERKQKEEQERAKRIMLESIQRKRQEEEERKRRALEELEAKRAAYEELKAEEAKWRREQEAAKKRDSLQKAQHEKARQQQLLLQQQLQQQRDAAAQPAASTYLPADPIQALDLAIERMTAQAQAEKDPVTIGELFNNIQSLRELKKERQEEKDFQERMMRAQAEEAKRMTERFAKEAEEERLAAEHTAAAGRATCPACSQEKESFFSCDGCGHVICEDCQEQVQLNAAVLCEDMECPLCHELVGGFAPHAPPSDPSRNPAAASQSPPTASGEQQVEPKKKPFKERKKNQKGSEKPHVQVPGEASSIPALSRTAKWRAKMEGKKELEPGRCDSARHRKAKSDVAPVTDAGGPKGAQEKKARAKAKKPQIPGPGLQAPSTTGPPP